MPNLVASKVKPNMKTLEVYKISQRNPKKFHAPWKIPRPMENSTTHGKLLHLAKVLAWVHSLSPFIGAGSGYSGKLRLKVFDHCNSDALQIAYQFFQKAECVSTL